MCPKADVAVAAISKAQEVGGSIRIIKRARDCSSDTVVSDGTSFSAAEVMERLSGFCSG
jgi:hypothetical protein